MTLQNCIMALQIKIKRQKQYNNNIIQQYKYSELYVIRQKTVL